MTICGKEFTISAVGSEAPHTLKELGHCTLSFKGGTEPDARDALCWKEINSQRLTFSRRDN